MIILSLRFQVVEWSVCMTVRKFYIMNCIALKQEDVSRKYEQISGHQGRMVGIRIYRLSKLYYDEFRALYVVEFNFQKLNTQKVNPELLLKSLIFCLSVGLILV